MCSVPLRRFQERAVRAISRVLAVVTVLAVLAAVAFFLSPIHYGAPPQITPTEGHPVIG